MRRKGRVFISHKSEESDFAEQLMTALVADGFGTWWDKEIQNGQVWTQELDDAIGSASAIVVLWSPKAVESPWVRHEASAAIARRVYVPARIELIAIPAPFDRIQATDIEDPESLQDDPGYQAVVQRLDELMPLPTPALVALQQWARQNFAMLGLVATLVAAFAVLANIYGSVNGVYPRIQDAADGLGRVQGRLERSLQSIETANEGIRKNNNALTIAIAQINATRNAMEAQEVRNLSAMLRPTDCTEPVLGAGPAAVRLYELKQQLHQVCLMRANLNDRSLQGAILWGAKLSKAYLEHTSLPEAEMQRADLRGAVLRSTDLWRAKLQHANLRGADLTDADLSEADLTDADLEGAVVDNANFTGARRAQSDAPIAGWDWDGGELKPKKGTRYVQPGHGP